MQSQKSSVVELASGRALEVSEGGDPKGFPVFSLHGSPGSKLLFQPHLEDAKKRSIRLIGYSRPGYGGSTRHRGRKMVDAAADVAAIADSLGMERFGVWGHSGGGTYALACASQLPNRIVAASSLSTVAPYGAEGLDWLAGMGEYNVEDFHLMMTDLPKWEAKNRADADVLANQSKADRMRLFATLLSAVDKPAFTDEVDEHFQQQSIDGFRRGIDGIEDDNLADVSPWGFNPADIKVPIQVWHGRHDMFVPFSHGQWLAAHIPHAEAHLEEREGHVSMFVNRIPEVQDWIVSRA